MKCRPYGGRLWKEALILLIALVFVYPIVLVVLNSFKTYAAIYENPFGLPDSFNFGNYAFVWSDMNYPSKLLNSVIVTVVPIPPILFFSSLAAYKLCRTKTRLSTFLFNVLVATMLIPFNVIMVPLLIMARNLRIGNSLWGLILIYVGFLTPFATFLYHGFIKNVKTDIEESARIDGCGNFGTYLHIVFPMLRPISATIIVLLALAFWNDFFLPLLMISKENLKTLPLAANKYSGLYMKDWSKSLPAVVLLSIPIFCVFFFLQRFILDGISQGAVKG